MKEVKKGLLIFAGTLSIVLAVIGALLPVMPTVPFLLLAAACYARSSQRFYNKLLNNRLVGKHIRNHREGRGISVRHKVIALLMLWSTIGFSAVVVVQLTWVRVILLIIAVSVTVHLLMIKTCRERGDE